jgi:hypothetical protein
MGIYPFPSLYLVHEMTHVFFIGASWGRIFFLLLVNKVCETKTFPSHDICAKSERFSCNLLCTANFLTFLELVWQIFFSLFKT